MRNLLNLLTNNREDDRNILFANKSLNNRKSLLPNIDTLITQNLSDINELFFQEAGILRLNSGKLIKDNHLNTIISHREEELDVDISGYLKRGGGVGNLDKRICALKEN